MSVERRERRYRVYFVSSARYEPPHVHIWRDGAFAKFRLDSASLQSSQGFSEAELWRIQRIVEKKSAEYLERWDEHFGRSREVAAAVSIAVSDDSLTATLENGRVISVPLSWYPRLAHASQAERDNWELIAFGEHIHWPDLDEYIGVAHLLAGWPSGESENSLRRWLEARRAAC